MKISEMRALLAKLSDDTQLRLIDDSGDVELCYLGISVDGKWLMLGGPGTEDQPEEKILWDTRPEPRLD